MRTCTHMCLHAAYLKCLTSLHSFPVIAVACMPLTPQCWHRCSTFLQRIGTLDVPEITSLPFNCCAVVLRGIDGLHVPMTAADVPI